MRFTESKDGRDRATFTVEFRLTEAEIAGTLLQHKILYGEWPVKKPRQIIIQIHSDLRRGLDSDYSVGDVTDEDVIYADTLARMLR
jgi:hypothetical protein